MNQTALIGRIVREIEPKYVGDNRMVVNNTLAVQRLYKSENGPTTDFIPFVAWGKTAELLNEYCKKGDLIGLTGKMQSRSYKKEQDEQVYVVELAADEVHFLQQKREADALV